MKFLVIFYFLKDSLLCLVSRLDLLTYSTLHNINFIADTNRNNYGLTFKMPAAPPLSRQCSLATSRVDIGPIVSQCFTPASNPHWPNAIFQRSIFNDKNALGQCQSAGRVLISFTDYGLLYSSVIS